MEIITKKIEDVTPADYNPRQITKEAMQGLIKSVEHFGYVEPIVWNQRTERIVGGHQRLQALKALGYDEAKVVVVDLDEVQEKALNVSLNNQHIAGTWEFQKLEDILDHLRETIPEICGTLRIDELSLELPKIDIDSIVDEVTPEQKAPAICEPGDLWLLGPHRLLCGDSTKEADVKRLLGTQKPILMVTDPPYGVEYDPTWRESQEIGHGAVKAKGKVENDDRSDWREAWKLFDAQVAYVWHAGKYASQVQESLESADYSIVSQIIWAKQHFVISRGDYHYQHEPCWYAAKKGKKHNWQGSRDQSSLWQIANNNPFGNNDTEEKLGHGTQKPIECMARPIQNNSSKGDIVCDPFLGSGTTLLAAESLGRKCYAMELSPEYCDMAIFRWEKNTGQKAKKAER